MRKVFISVPMKGRTEEAIRASFKKIIELEEVVSGEEIEWVNQYDPELAPAYAPEGLSENGRKIWMLGESLKKLAMADYYIGIQQDGYYSGCDIEAATARTYGIDCFMMQEQLWKEIMPDAWKIYAGRWNELSQAKTNAAY